MNGATITLIISFVICCTFGVINAFCTKYPHCAPISIIACIASVVCCVSLIVVLFYGLFA